MALIMWLSGVLIAAIVIGGVWFTMTRKGRESGPLESSEEAVEGRYAKGNMPPEERTVIEKDLES